MVASFISHLSARASTSRSNDASGWAGDAAAGRASALPCLNRNNSNEGTNAAKFADFPRLPSNVRKGEFVLKTEVKELARIYGIERLGFFTLTFADHVIDRKEASRRFNSLLTGVLKKRYPTGIKVMERQKSGRIHFHCVVALDRDIRTGFDFPAAARGHYGSANAALRSEWAFWRETCKKYGFGRHELMPVKSNALGLAKYVGKYLGKHFQVRNLDDKGARLVGYWGYKASSLTRSASCRFSWAKGGAFKWRSNLQMIDRIAQAVCPIYSTRGADGLARLRYYWGKKWAWEFMKADFVNKPALAVLSIERMEEARAKYETGRKWVHPVSVKDEAAPPLKAHMLPFFLRPKSSPAGAGLFSAAQSESGLAIERSSVQALHKG